jgi:hypothetical protein
MSGGGRVLCSHLVRLRVDGAERPAEWGNLEEIDAFGAVVASERAWPTQVEVRIEAQGFDAPGYIQSCRRRETDFLLTIEFVEGFRWSEAAWKPDHLFAPPGKAKGAKAG